jgi:hypothetical protein
MNELFGFGQPPCCLKFASDRAGRDYYFDLSRMTADGECPVIVFEPQGTRRTIAFHFLDFLRKTSRGVLSSERELC